MGGKAWYHDRYSDWKGGQNSICICFSILMKFLCIPHASEYTKKEQKSITFCDNLCCAYCFTSVLKQWFLGHFNSSLLHGKYLISAVISPLWYKKVVSVSLSELKTNLGAKIGEKIGGDMTVEVYIYNIIIFVASNEGMHDVAWKGGARPNIISALEISFWVIAKSV